MARSKPDNNQGQLVVFIRWVAVFPTAVLGSMVARWLYISLNKSSMLFIGMNPNSLISFILITTVGGFILGSTFVYISAYVAPSHEKKVALTFAFMFVFLAGASMFTSFMTSEWRSLAEIAFGVAGACVVAYERAINDTPLGNIF